MNWQSVLMLITDRLQSDFILDAVLLLTILALVRSVLLSRRITLLTRGKSGASLESTIATLNNGMEKLHVHADKTEVVLNNLDTRVQSAVRGVSVERFDPFQNAGGQQSFACALLNETGNGVVLSGIHARDGVRVYAKEIRTFTSERELSDEERSAIATAQKKLGSPAAHSS